MTVVRITPDTQITQSFNHGRSAQVDVSDLRCGDVVMIKTRSVDGKLVARTLVFARPQPNAPVWPERTFP